MPHVFLVIKKHINRLCLHQFLATYSPQCVKTNLNQAFIFSFTCSFKKVFWNVHKYTSSINEISTKKKDRNESWTHCANRLIQKVQKVAILCMILNVWFWLNLHSEGWKANAWKSIETLKLKPEPIFFTPAKVDTANFMPFE